MDHATLKRLAEVGVSDLPPSLLFDLSPWCWDYGEITGDARYCSLSRTLDIIVEAYEQYSMVSTVWLAELDQLFINQLPDVLVASSSEDGSLLARSLRDAVEESYRRIGPLG
jgi:hypothetical protein